MIKQLILVGIGGGVGSMFRYITSWWVSKHTLMAFPLGTFWVNILGCVLIGLFVGLSLRFGWIGKEFRLLFITGFCGGYTTFSTFSLENMELMKSGNYYTLGLYVAASVVLGIIAVGLGIWLAKIEL
ncbi:fluoride efflux transporter CrcB [Parabacteroides sp. 52]|uniref:fluoride efflux transporter CrcB n=1 Tax=unclassified Parabacteroides TaxID=2649774 RepID=UPI0013D3FA3B|nr:MULTISPECIES: fluoride efflux transporter CrcB [unclassified Parabacteroides]MDH6534380.1 CrcB protein [Parabacteroides sp. PM5-20]NDV54879.1 fluoride efflux transporter CrcB [Parabacteroides sp. 52]